MHAGKEALMERERAGGGYTVHELAELSGCTVRTLHHYDELGLVRARRASNGYRRYGAAEVDRLHQVLLYRECGLPPSGVCWTILRSMRATRWPATCASCMRTSSDWTD